MSKIDLVRKTSWLSRQYPPEFSVEFKRSIRKRDKQRCCVCNKRKKLDIHHIDYRKENTVPANCISICRDCHEQIHASSKHEKIIWKIELSKIAQARENAK